MRAAAAAAAEAEYGQRSQTGSIAGHTHGAAPLPAWTAFIKEGPRTVRPSASASVSRSQSTTSIHPSEE